MIERAYTVSEIDHLRNVCKGKVAFGVYTEIIGECRVGRKDYDEEVYIEEMVRTHMLAGHSAEELLQSNDDEYTDGAAA